MNSKRRAELQRKLSMGEVPRPPADLSERIKGDIPKYLSVEKDRAYFTGSVAFSMRVAASILLLLTTALVTLRLLEPAARPIGSREQKQVAAAAPVPAVNHYSTNATTAGPAQQTEEVSLQIEQQMPLPVAAPPALRVAPQTATGLRREAVDEERADTGITVGRLAAANETEAAADDFGDTPHPTSVAAAAPAPAPVPPPPAPARDSSRDASARATTVTAQAPMIAPAPSSLMSEAYANELDLGPQAEVFGISVDPRAFLDIKAALEKGTRPTGPVDVEALVNYFAGAPPRPSRRAVTLDVEASPAPVEAEGDHAVLRFTVDTAKAEVRGRASTPPVAQDARVEIDIEDEAVASFRRIGGVDTIAAQPTLLHNVSVTALYQLELKPRLKASQKVATVRLRYRSISDGKEAVITRVIHGRDLAKQWSRASRRHRLASLGAVWSESLKGAAAGVDVAKRAEELASQKPADSRARDLANAASATAGGER
jgi:hypothetical protein